MKHSGKAQQAALKLVLLSLAAVLVILLAGALAAFFASLVWSLSIALVILWLLFTAFTFYFFRDPDARTPSEPGVVVSPAHGKVDAICQHAEPVFMGGPCQRISIFLSVIDIHVQNAPVSGKITCFKYSTGQFLSALKAESAEHNENLLLGFEGTNPPVKIGVRVIAGVLARRIVPFAKQDESVNRGERISLVQFGSRADLYLPLSANLRVKLGDHVVGGETVMAVLQ